MNEQLQQVEALIKANQHREALQVLKPILKESPANAEAWWLAANALEDPAQVRQALVKVLVANPSDTRAVQMLAKQNGIPLSESNGKTSLAPKMLKTINPAQAVIQLEQVSKDLKTGDLTLRVLDNVSFCVERGELLGIIGPSGSGKSTLLGLMGGLDAPTEGKIILDGTDISSLNEKALTRIRNEKIGFVFQFFNLIPTMTALENVELPLQISRSKKESPKARAEELLTLFGLQDRMRHRPTQLSGGQQQRVALARALANQPPLLLCDEPTGNLDSEARHLVMDALRKAQKELNTTIVIVTHDNNVAAQVDRLISLADGKLV